MTNQPDAMETRHLDYIARGVTPTALTGPMRVRLLSALGSNDAAGTPVTTGTTPWINYGANTTYTQVANATQTSNTGVLRYEGLPNPTTVAGMQIGDSAATPFITLDNIARTGGAATVVDGIFEIPAGGLTAASS